MSQRGGLEGLIHHFTRRNNAMYRRLDDCHCSLQQYFDSMPDIGAAFREAGPREREDSGAPPGLKYDEVAAYYSACPFEPSLVNGLPRGFVVRRTGPESRSLLSDAVERAFGDGGYGPRVFHARTPFLMVPIYSENHGGPSIEELVSESNLVRESSLHRDLIRVEPYVLARKP